MIVIAGFICILNSRCKRTIKSSWSFITFSDIFFFSKLNIVLSFFIFMNKLHEMRQVYFRFCFSWYMCYICKRSTSISFSFRRWGYWSCKIIMCWSLNCFVTVSKCIIIISWKFCFESQNIHKILIFSNILHRRFEFFVHDFEFS